MIPSKDKRKALPILNRKGFIHLWMIQGVLLLLNVSQLIENKEDTENNSAADSDSNISVHYVISSPLFW